MHPLHSYDDAFGVEALTGPLATAIQALKLGCARRLLAEERRRQRNAEHHQANRVWQARYYDFNIRAQAKLVEKLRYIHPNPVKRGLVKVPELWPWSSFQAYAYQETGMVRVNEWGVLRMKILQPTVFPS